MERKQTETEQAFLYLKEQQEQTTREIKDLRDLTLSVRDLTLCVNSMKEDVDEVKAAVREQSKRPSMWLDKIIWAVLGGGIAALVTFKVHTLGAGVMRNIPIGWNLVLSGRKIKNPRFTAPSGYCMLHTFSLGICRFFMCLHIGL